MFKLWTWCMNLIKFKKQESAEYIEFRKDNQDIKRLSITGLIMVKNQEENIVRTIDSIVPFCDSVIVVDTGSTDSTISKVANTFPDVIRKKLSWKENYGEMRNQCLKFVSNNSWVLFIDSDESLITKCSVTELRAFLYKMDIDYPNVDKACTVKQMQPSRNAFVRPERFIKKTKTLYYYGHVHEEPRSKKQTSLLKIDTDMQVMNVGLTKNEYKKFNKDERYVRLLAKNLKDEPDNPRWVSLITPQFLKCGFISRESYIQLLKKCILKNANLDLDEYNLKQGVYLNDLLERLCLEMFFIKDIDKTEKYIKIARKIYPYAVFFQVLEATMFFSNIENKSEKRLKQIIEFTNNTSDEVIDNESEGNEEALNAVVVRLLIHMGKYDQAKEIYEAIDDSFIKDGLSNEAKLFK